MEIYNKTYKEVNFLSGFEIFYKNDEIIINF